MASQRPGYVPIGPPTSSRAYSPSAGFQDAHFEGDKMESSQTSQEITPRFSHRLGSLAILVITLGWAVELGTLGFLLYIWSGRGKDPGGGYATQLWRNIMLRDLASRTATLSSLALRTAVDLQATVCTAMVAALMLEARDVQMANVALFSVLRAVNGGPSSVVQPLIQTPGKFIRSLPAFIILVLFLSTVATQFSSTLLLSDFRQASLLTDTTYGHIPVLETQPELLLPLTNSTGGTSSLAWQQAMTSYPPFGERTIRARLTSTSVSDTGGVKRAFLPFQARQRQNLRRYEGAAVTYESRVACVHPSLTGKIYAGSDRLSLPRIAGNLSWVSDVNDPDFTGLSCDKPGQCDDVPFDCALPFNISGSKLQTILSKRPLSVCLVGRQPTSLSFTRGISNLFLVLDTLSDFNDWNNSIPGTIPGSADQGEWALLDFGQNARLNVTVCFSNATMRLENVTMDASEDLAEPSLNYDPASGTWNTDDIAKLMGVDSSVRIAERGVMNVTDTRAISSTDLDAMFRSSANFDFLSQEGTAEDLRDQFFSFVLSNVQGGILTATGATNFSIYFCSGCNLSPNFTDIHPHYPILFNAFLGQTGSPAAGWQSMLFWLAQAQYYNALSGFDFGNNSTMVFSRAVSIPQVWFGLTSVTGIIMLNIACVAVTTWLFMHRTKYSAYGNSWHAVSQVLSPDTRHLLDRATQATDDQVKKSLRETGSDKVDAGLWKLDSGRVAVVRRTSPFKYTEIG